MSLRIKYSTVLSKRFITFVSRRGLRASSMRWTHATETQIYSVDDWIAVISYRDHIAIDYVACRSDYLADVQRILTRPIMLRCDSLALVTDYSNKKLCACCFQTIDLLAQYCSACENKRATIHDSDRAAWHIIWLWSHARTDLCADLKAHIMGDLYNICLC